MTDLETIKSLQEELDRIVANQSEIKKQCEEMERINAEREQLFKELAERNMALSVELDIKTADLAQMKSTLSDTQQKLRAVQEDRDEFAAKMNDAMERADQLQARCGDLESILKERDSEKISLLQQICQLKVECGDMEKERDEAAEKIKDFENLKRRIEGMMEAFQLIVKGSSIE